MRELADRALARIVDCLESREPVHSAPTVVKSASLILQLICEKEVGKGGFSLQELVALATQDDSARSLPEKPSDAVDAVEAEYVPVPVQVPTTTPVDPPPPSREEVRAERYSRTDEGKERAAQSRAKPVDPVAVKAAVREVMRSANHEPPAEHKRNTGLGWDLE